MQLSADQTRALEALVAALRAGQRVSVLVGPAGSGKTTLLRALIDTLTEEVTLLCPTGKAAARLSEVTGLPARTVHSALYGMVDAVDGALVFGGRRAPCQPGGLVICDEASMVDAELHQDLLGHLPPGARLLYVGDREQLPPVQGTWGPDFAAPTAVLDTVHRQAEASPVLALATAIRLGRPWQGWQDGVCERREVQDPELEPAAWLAERLDRDATLITWTNDRRRALNARVRQLIGHTTPVQVGDRLVCLRNNTEVGVMNGEVRRVLAAERSPGASWLHRGEIWELELEDTGRVLVNAEVIGAPLDAFTRWRGRKRGALDRAIHVDFGFCLTVHKAQGSQWQEVGFVSCPAFRGMPDRRRLAYTAVTRAAERLVIFMA